MEQKLVGATNFNDRSDMGVALMYQGRAKEAIPLLQQLEKEKPGEYYVAANLGTAYELAGNNEQALHWINEGIRRNPADHEGTEWLHARILESKIALQKDPLYFTHNSVLQLHPEDATKPITANGKTFGTDQVKKAIEYQLSERMQFVKPPDPAVASLLFDYSAIEAATGTLEDAKGILKLAVEYGYPATQVQPLLAFYDRQIEWGKWRPSVLASPFVLALVGLIIYGWKKGWIYYKRS